MRRGGRQWSCRHGPDAEVDTEADVSDDPIADVDDYAEDVELDVISDSDDDAELDVFEGECLEVVDFMCCEGDVMFRPVCGSNGWYCAEGTPSEACFGDVGADSSTPDAG